MLYEAIRLGPNIYQTKVPFAYDYAYTQFLAEKDQSKWDNPDNLDLYEIEKLRVFLNENWRARMQMQHRGRDLRLDLQYALQRALPYLNRLQDNNIISVDLNDSNITKPIIYAFDTIARYGPRSYESTGASKIVHTIIPELFVMWDSAIRGGYGVGEDAANKNTHWKREGEGYVRYFLPRMQRLAESAITQVMEKECRCRNDAINSLKSGSRTLAKTLDEYNYSKFTVNSDRVWQEEYKV